jgi:plasmid stabilization system protein ParE
LILVWAPDAFADLARERRYLAARNPTGARNQLARIRRAARALLTFPRMGTEVRLGGHTAFVFPVPRTEYLLIYQIVDDVVQIRRVWSGRRGTAPFERPS